jgi:hypothetical protein
MRFERATALGAKLGPEWLMIAFGPGKNCRVTRTWRRFLPGGRTLETG